MGKIAFIARLSKALSIPDSRLRSFEIPPRQSFVVCRTRSSKNAGAGARNH